MNQYEIEIQNARRADMERNAAKARFARQHGRQDSMIEAARKQIGRGMITIGTRIADNDAR